MRVSDSSKRDWLLSESIPDMQANEKWLELSEAALMGLGR